MITSNQPGVHQLHPTDSDGEEVGGGITGGGGGSGSGGGRSSTRSSTRSCKFDAVLATDLSTAYFSEACSQIESRQMKSAARKGGGSDAVVGGGGGSVSVAANGDDVGGGATNVESASASASKPTGQAELLAEGCLLNVAYDANRWAGRAGEWHVDVQATK
jgi:hypothetical protein